MGCALPGLAATGVGELPAGDGWAVWTMAPLMLAGLPAALPVGPADTVAGGVAFASLTGFTAGTGGAVSTSSFWKSKTEICCALPSSDSAKSPFFRSSTTLPALSLTVTSMITSVVLDVKVTGACCASTGPNARRKPIRIRSAVSFRCYLLCLFSNCRYGG